MKFTLFRYVLLALIGVGLSACDDDSTDLSSLGTPSDVRVRVYLEVDGDAQFEQGVDEALAGVTVTLVNTQTDESYQADTGSDGLAVFEDVPAGAYLTTVDEADLPDGLVEVSVADPGLEQTIVAPYEGDEDGVDETFVFRYMPATIQGTVYQDVDRSGDYDPDVDTQPAAGVQIDLYEGDEATGTPVATAETDDDGVFSFDVYPATYTLDVVPNAQTEVVTDEPMTFDVGATEVLDATIVVRSAIQTIASAESQPDSAVVLVDGVVTVDRGTISGSYFWIQDPTGGVKVYVGSGWTGDYVRGDSLRVQGEIVTNFGEKSIEATAIEDLGTGEVPDPILLDGAELLTALHQGELVRVDTVLVDSVGSGSSYNAYVTDPSTGDEFVVRVDSDTDIGSGVFIPGQRYTVTGVSSPFGGAEQIYPRSMGDILPLDAATVSVAAARGAPVGAQVTARGVVHTATGTISSSYFFMHDGSAGIQVYVGGIEPTPTLARGDSVEITGTVGERFGEMQISATAVDPLGTGTVRDPIVVTGAELLLADTQGNLVTVPTVTVDSIDDDTSGSYNVYVTDPESSTEFIIRVDSGVGIAGDTFTVGNSYTVTGVSRPFGGLEQVYPRDPSDIVAN